jgi:hypothetical protein
MAMMQSAKLAIEYLRQPIFPISAVLDATASRERDQLICQNQIDIQ